MARAAFVIDRVMGRIGLEGRSFVRAAVLVRLRRARDHGDAHDPVAAGAPRHDPRGAAHDLLGAAARLHAADQRVRAGSRGPRADPARRGSCCSRSTCRRRDGRARRRGGDQADARARATACPSHGAADLSQPDAPALALAGLSSVRAFLRRAGTIILLATVTLWLLLHFPRVEAPARARRAGGRGLRPRAQRRRPPRPRHRAPDRAARLRLEDRRRPRREPRRPRGHRRDPRPDLRDGVRRGRLACATRCAPTATATRASPSTRRPPSAALLVFFVFALQCTSTIAIMRRETNSWRWPAFAFAYLLALAYGASFVDLPRDRGARMIADPRSHAREPSSSIGYRGDDDPLPVPQRARRPRDLSRPRPHERLRDPGQASFDHRQDRHAGRSRPLREGLPDRAPGLRASRDHLVGTPRPHPRRRRDRDPREGRLDDPPAGHPSRARRAHRRPPSPMRSARPAPTRRSACRRFARSETSASSTRNT